MSGTRTFIFKLDELNIQVRQHFEASWFQASTIADLKKEIKKRLKIQQDFDFIYFEKVLRDDLVLGKHQIDDLSQDESFMLPAKLKQPRSILTSASSSAAATTISPHPLFSASPSKTRAMPKKESALENDDLLDRVLRKIEQKEFQLNGSRTSIEFTNEKGEWISKQVPRGAKEIYDLINKKRDANNIEGVAFKNLIKNILSCIQDKTLKTSAWCTLGYGARTEDTARFYRELIGLLNPALDEADQVKIRSSAKVSL